MGADRYPGCYVKTLVIDKTTELLTVLLKMDPGAELPDHEHVMLEQTFMLEGRLVDKEGPMLACPADPANSSGARRAAATPPTPPRAAS